MEFTEPNTQPLTLRLNARLSIVHACHSEIAHLETSLSSWKHQYLLGNAIINLEASVLTWKHSKGQCKVILYLSDLIC